MDIDMSSLDAHEQPSEELRAAWKAFSKADPIDLVRNGDIDDPSDSSQHEEFRQAGTIPAQTLATAFSNFVQGNGPPFQVDYDAPIYYHPLLPGLLILPSLVPPEIQKILLTRILHRDLSNPKHQTNMHLHFNLPYPSDGASFFSHTPGSSVRFEPKDPAVHKPLSMEQVMGRKLHWVTLGGQYDWTNRVYPGEEPPAFPPDMGALLASLFPETVAQAAIVNFYSPGDTMMMHRDVSEETDKGLISISIGCDCLFMIAPNDIGETPDSERPRNSKSHLLLRIRSGDAIYMTKDSRFAWHGVPKILKDTCPDFLADWPGVDGEFEEWRGWLRHKRVNLNVRQMRN